MNNTDEIQINFSDAYTRTMSQQVYDRAITQLRSRVTPRTDSADRPETVELRVNPVVYNSEYNVEFTTTPIPDRTTTFHRDSYGRAARPNPWAEMDNPFRPSYKIDDTQDIFYTVKGKRVGIGELVERVEYLEAVIAKLMGPQVEEMKI